jgi:hypothetical protein
MKDPEKHQMSTGAMHIGESHGEMPEGKDEPSPKRANSTAGRRACPPGTSPTFNPLTGEWECR